MAVVVGFWAKNRPVRIVSKLDDDFDRDGVTLGDPPDYDYSWVERYGSWHTVADGDYNGETYAWETVDDNGHIRNALGTINVKKLDGIVLAGLQWRNAYLGGYSVNRFLDVVANWSDDDNHVYVRVGPELSGTWYVKCYTVVGGVQVLRGSVSAGYNLPAPVVINVSVQRVGNGFEVFYGVNSVPTQNVASFTIVDGEVDALVGTNAGIGWKQGPPYTTNDPNWYWGGGQALGRYFGVPEERGFVDFSFDKIVL